MYSMEKLARGIIHSAEQREFQEKRWDECKARCKPNADRWRREKLKQGCALDFAEYKDRPRGKLEG